MEKQPCVYILANRPNETLYIILGQYLESAILRKKQLKNWSRVAKKRLIERGNPQWQDLSPDLWLPSLAAGSRHSLPG